MNLPDRARLRTLVTRLWPLIAVLLATAGVTVAVTTSDDNHDGQVDHVTGVLTTPQGTATVILGGPGKKAIALPPAAQQIVQTQAAEAAAGDAAAAESNLHDTALPAPAAQAKAQHLKPPGQPRIPANVPAATVYRAGCTTALVRNYSSRSGAPILFGFLHWTGSRSIPGSLVDGLAIVRWFDQPISQASSNYITDDDGHCWLVVPESQKAWTQGNANLWSVSDEHVNPGAGPLFTSPKGRVAVLRLMRHWHRDLGIPYRHGIIRQGPPRPGSRMPTCIPVRSGFLAHRDAGACGGGHPDVGSFDVDGLIREAAAGDLGARPITSSDRITCRKLNWWRAQRRPHGMAETNAVRRRKALASRHVTCTAKGPARA